MNRIWTNLSTSAIALLLTSSANCEAHKTINFLQDQHFRRNRVQDSEKFLFNKLMERSQPLSTTQDSELAVNRALENDNDDADANDDANDDASDEAASGFGSNLKQVYDFSNYSLRYARCQLVQRFSERAVKRGEYSAMTKDNLVILRMCPSNSCSSSTSNGCNSGYGEFIIALKDYLSVMMEYESYKRESLCEFCSYCTNYYGGGRRILSAEIHENQMKAYYGASNDDGNSNGNDDGNANGNGDDYYQASNSSSYEDNTPDYDCDSYYKSACSGYVDTCANSVSDYTEYLSCVEVKSGESKYYLGPYCDGTAIIMGVFYDPYCSQYAGNSVNINQVSGMSFTKSEFESYYSGSCISCSSENDEPYGYANSLMCNEIYEDSAKCVSNMAVKYDSGYVFNYQSTVCEYSKSILNDAFNSNGSISSVSASSTTSTRFSRRVTAPQITLLVLGTILCMGLSLYACYLHHEITNLLLKQLSMRGKLLPKPRKRAYDDSASESGDSTSTGDESGYVMA